MPITGLDMLPTKNSKYLISNPADSNNILKKLKKDHHLQESGREIRAEHYFDTFDWRLYRKNLLFSISKNRIYLRHFNGTYLHEAEGRKRSKFFCRDIDDDRMAQLLEKHIQMRALCPTVSLRVEDRYFKVLNRDRKTVVRIEFSRSVAANGSEEMELPERLAISGLRGYEKSYEKILNSLDGLSLPAMKRETELIDLAYGNNERQPLDYGGKFHVKLDPDVRIGTAVSTICLELLASMELNYAGVCNDIDSEFLHDFRIAVRRTRSLMSLLRKVLPRKQLHYFETEFKWLGGVTGPVRDIDVYLLKKETYQGLLPESLRGGLALFFEQLAQQRSGELTLLRNHLRSERTLELIKRWRAFLSDPSSELFQGVRKKSCQPLVNKIIRKRFNRFIADGDQISDQSEDEQLHKLRIKGKKFRYLLEFFRSFYEDRSINLLLKHMKKVQDNLGDFNDLSVQTAMLNEKLEQLKARNKQTILLAAALGSLITRLKQGHIQVRGEFNATYQEFSTKELKELMGKLTTAHLSSAPAKRKK